MKRAFAKIFRQSRHNGRYFVAALAFFAAIFILLFTLRSYSFFNAYFKEAKKDQATYIIINKGVNALQSFGQNYRSTFSEEEIKYIAEQDFIEDLGRFSNSTFHISSNLAERLAIYTDLFFESVPDRFLDTIPPAWGWSPGSRFIPVIINREWLNLYNFNVSLMYGLPQISEEILSKWTIDVLISGNEKQDRYESRIVAFSDRIPSVIVPESFLHYANDIYGKGTPLPSRLILRVSDPGNPELLRFLDEHHYQYNKEKSIGSGFRALARGLLQIGAALSFLFLLFTLTILITTLRLIISDMSSRIRLLLLLGHPVKSVSRQVFRGVFIYLSLAWLLAISAYLLLDRHLIELFGKFASQNMPVFPWLPLLWSLVLSILVLLYLYLFINRKVRQLAMFK